MAISRRGFLKLSLGTISGFLISSISKAAKPLFAAGEAANVTEAMYKLGDKVPQAGRYQCIVCGLIVEYLPKLIEKEVTFGICTVCNAGTEKGPKKLNEEFWKHIS